ncbi:hypothetical protein [Phaeobacter gallaeciensis]|uniref:Uncharacterized protein n=1 Tax=Phaeobacter gallaeciensis TaxID=60890 RepID=A0AAD0EBB4_9RHOB|nr:hypothetical protein [Phaeobacter gallaeciensis]AHD09542.1 hypothetical protein Gal_01786 [Phaeobacter gallaeciensis DSM 26640]ATE92807.1 hypothetical protein PhaeoP11_01779 [Phaeobacter gallaeciensis]ATE97371.1 hypothetical protein PhaeoP73_02067 [Phaeobacter gallaeciensis]ATF01472.1 hypothetical protein PhaeoP75_01829 [Phaeobacter gallaeciensis]ATF05852.1 hypothetical protein PhaeoP63_01777 [Phaeobacter gallaeciensis]
MPVTQVPAFTKVPSRSDTPDTFSADVDSFLSEIPDRALASNQQAQEVNAAAEQVATQAATVAEASAAFESGVNADRWAAGDYSDGDAVWSPTDGLTYRAKADFTSVLDPASDPANWHNLNPVEEAGKLISARARRFATWIGA